MRTRRLFQKEPETGTNRNNECECCMLGKLGCTAPWKQEPLPQTDQPAHLSRSPHFDSSVKNWPMFHVDFWDVLLFFGWDFLKTFLHNCSVQGETEFKTLEKLKIKENRMSNGMKPPKKIKKTTSTTKKRVLIYIFSSSFRHPYTLLLCSTG